MNEFICLFSVYAYFLCTQIHSDLMKAKKADAKDKILGENLRIIS